MDLTTLRNPPNKLFPSQPNQRKPFYAYRRAQKEIWNYREFRLARKRHIKAFASIKCQEFYWTMDNIFSINKVQLYRLRSLVKILKHNKSLRALKLLIQTRENFHINLILPHLKHLRALSKVTLDLLTTKSLTSKVCHSFALSIKNLKQLTYLDHNIGKNLQNPSKSRKTFRHFPLLRRLSHLSLSFDSTKTLTDQYFAQFSCCLSHLQSLTSFSLNLNNCEGLTKIGLSDLFSSLGKLSLLSTFSLKSHCLNLTSHLLIELFQHLQDLPYLQELTLSLSACKIAKISGQQEPLAAGLSLINPSSLRKIYLDFYSVFSDSDFSNLLVLLRRFSSLTHLQFGFNQVDYAGGPGCSSLHETLSHFPSLKHFSFVENCYRDPSLVLNSLSHCLLNLKHLQSLEINTYNNESLTNFALRYFSTNLYHLSGLRYLHLNFTNCRNLSDRGLESIAFALRGQENLESLDLRLEMLDEVTNRGAMALGSSIAELKGLRNLQFRLGFCQNVGGGGLGSFVAGLKRLSCLNEIYLTCGSWGNKSDLENYEDLVEVVSRMDVLRKIYLRIPRFGDDQSCDEISEKVGNSSKNFTIDWI